MIQKPLTRRTVLRLGGGIVSAVGLAAVAPSVAFADTSGYTFGLWKGGSGDQRIWWNFFDTGGWTTPQVVPGAGTSAGVAMAGTNQAMAVATWKGVTGDERIWWNSLVTGSWSTPQVVPGANSSVGPALVTSGLGAIMMWKGGSGDQRVWWNYFDSAVWTSPQVMPGAATSFAPAAAFRPGVPVLHVAWKGVDGDQRIWWSTLSGSLSGTWSSPQVVPGAGTSAGVSLAAMPNGNLVMAWKGVTGDQQIWWSQSYPGSPGSWTAPQVVPGTGTGTGPSLAANGNAMAMTWKGVDGDERVWWSRFDGTNWTAPQVIAGAGTSFRPAVATSPWW